MEVCGWGEVPSSLSAGLDSGRVCARRPPLRRSGASPRRPAHSPGITSRLPKNNKQVAARKQVFFRTPWNPVEY